MSVPSSDELVQDPIGRYPSATVACFDPTTGELPRRRLHAGRNVQFLERLAALQVPAVLIAASTGHGHLRDVGELLEWFRASAQADLGETMKMALLRPEDGFQATAQLIAELRSLQYPVVFIRPGTDLPPNASDEQVVQNMQPMVAEAAKQGMAVGVYSIPDVSGVALSADAVASLVAKQGGERIVAAKVTEADYASSTLRFLQHPDLAHLKIVQGWDTHLARALQDGPRHDAQGRQRCGVTSGPMSLAVFQYQHVLQEVERGSWQEVAEAQKAVTALFQSMQDDPSKFADLQRAKYIMGLGQPLTGKVTDEQVERVFAALESLPRDEDRSRLARSLDLLGDGPYHDRLSRLS